MKKHLSPKELAQAIGVSESSLKRWADSGLIRSYRTGGGHRRIDLNEAVRFIRASDMPVREPRVLGMAELEGHLDHGRRGDDSAALATALERGDAVAVRAIVVAMYLAGSSVADICDGPLASAMHDFGEVWWHREDGIMIEHRATDVSIATLHHLRALLPAPEAGAAMAIGGAPANDPYLLPSLMACTVLSSEGWHATNLGPNTPPDVLSRAATDVGARLAWVSISVDAGADQMAGDLLAVADQIRARGASLVVGGRAVPPSLKSDCPNLHHAGSMVELCAFARGLRASQEDPSTPGAATS